MARIRTIKPEFFRHGDLYDLDKRTGLPVRLLYIALWTICDKLGQFRWRVREMRFDLMPYDTDEQTEACLDALVEGGFVTKYEVDGVPYGFIPTFKRHQRITGKELLSPPACPSPTRPREAWESPDDPSGHIGEVSETHPRNTREAPGNPSGADRETPEKHRASNRETPGKLSDENTEAPEKQRKGMEGKGREGNGIVPPSAFPDPGELAVMSVDQIHDLMLAATTEGELYALTGELKRRRGE